MDKEKRIRILQQISTIVGTCWVFLGLIAGILFPMIWMAPLLFSSWALFASIGHNSWANSYLMIDYNDPRVYLTLYVVEATIFLLGFVIFILGLSYLVKGRYHKEILVTQGPYRFIRHPQNLGILLMILPFALYIPPFLSFSYHTDPGIRLGEIVSWILMVGLLGISSLIEEAVLIKKIGDMYLEYRARTGLFLPKIGKKTKKRKFCLWKSVLLILAIYIVIVALIFGLQRLLLELGLVYWSRTF